MLILHPQTVRQGNFIYYWLYRFIKLLKTFCVYKNMKVAKKCNSLFEPAGKSNIILHIVVQPVCKAWTNEKENHYLNFRNFECVSINVHLFEITSLTRNGHVRVDNEHQNLCVYGCVCGCLLCFVSIILGSVDGYHSLCMANISRLCPMCASCMTHLHILSLCVLNTHTHYCFHYIAMQRERGEQSDINRQRSGVGRFHNRQILTI